MLGEMRCDNSIVVLSTGYGVKASAGLGIQLASDNVLSVIGQNGGVMLQPTVALLYDHAQRRPQASQLISRRWELTTAQVAGYVARMARAFGQRGIASGDLVSIACDNDLAFLVTLALEQIGATSCTAPSGVAHDALGISWHITDVVAETAAQTILIDDAFMVALVSVEPLLTIASPSTETTPVRLIFSSGTSGIPVAVPFTLEQVIQRATLAEAIWMPDRPFMSLITMASASGYLTAMANVRSGDTYFSPGDPIDNARLLRENNVSTVKASPVQLAALCALPDLTFPDLSRIESAGGPLSVALAQRLSEVAPSASLLNLYGSTEAGTIAVARIADDGTTPPAVLVAGADVEVVDDLDQPLPHGTEGLIRWRRPYQATHYADGTRTSLRDGWFYPGDRGVIHPDGTFSILGRADNLVNSGGVKVQLEALDARLSTVPGLVDWAYFTDVDAFGIERLILAAVALPEHQSTLVAAVNERTPDVPVNRLYLVDEIPRNAMGKVLRHELRQRFATLASQQ